MRRTNSIISTPHGSSSLWRYQIGHGYAATSALRRARNLTRTGLERNREATQTEEHDKHIKFRDRFITLFLECVCRTVEVRVIGSERLRVPYRASCAAISNFPMVRGCCVALLIDARRNQMFVVFVSSRRQGWNLDPFCQS